MIWSAFAYFGITVFTWMFIGTCVYVYIIIKNYLCPLPYYSPRKFPTLMEWLICAVMWPIFIFEDRI